MDNFLYTFNVSCRLDRTNGGFCDTQFSAWLNESTLTSAQNCSDCLLGVEAFELGSPFGYDAVLASNFASMTSSCGASGYTFTTPTAYGLNGTSTNTIPATSTASATTACSASYTLVDGDDCNTVAKANNVSTFSLLDANNLNIYCANFPATGTSLCLPPECDVYTVQPGDTCLSVVTAAGGITQTQLLAWNPNLGSLCYNLYSFVGFEICISPPGGYFDPTTTSNLSVSYAVTAASIPTNAQVGSNRACGKWYEVSWIVPESFIMC